MHLTATGRIAGPERPPVPPLSTGLKVLVSITIPSSVFIRLRPLTPALITEPAISTMSVTSGDSFAKSGTLLMCFLTALTASCAVTGLQAKTLFRFSTLGHEIFTSIAKISGRFFNL